MLISLLLVIFGGLCGWWIGRVIYKKNKKQFVSPTLIMVKPKSSVAMTKYGVCIDKRHLDINYN